MPRLTRPALLSSLLLSQLVILSCTEDGANTETETTGTPTTTTSTTDPSGTVDPSTTQSETDDPTGDSSMTTDGPTTDGPTTDGPTTDEPTTDEPTTTSDTEGDCDLEADVIVVERNLGGPIFTAASESLVGIVDGELVEISLCGEILSTVVSDVDLGFGEGHALTPTNTRLYFTNDAGIARVSFPSGDNFEQIVADGAIYELAVTPAETELFYHVNGGDAFHVILDPLGQPQLLDIGPTPRAFHVSPDGSKLAYMDNADDIYTLEIGSETPEFQVHVANGPRRVVQWMPDGERILFLEDLGQNTKVLRTFHINTDETVDFFPIDDFLINTFALAPDGSRVVLDRGQSYKTYKL